MSRNYNYVVTYNNYPNTDLFDSIECGYIAYGHEVAPTTGTPHLQGFIHFENACSLRAARRRLPGCDVRPMRGRFDQCEAYCSKESELVKRGVCPQFNINNGANEASRWKDVWEAAKEGRLEDIPDKIRIQYYSTFKKIKYDYQPTVANLNPREHCGVWIYGPSGSGKTTSVWDKYPDLYEKMHNQWWDDYEMQEVVLLDEFDAHNVKDLATQLKAWAGWSVFRGEIKGASMKLRPKKFIVCSNHHLNELMPTNHVLYDALKNRFKFVYKESISDNVCELI
nr:MAG: replication associated protein [Cressdnaviricota sp.]